MGGLGRVLSPPAGGGEREPVMSRILCPPEAVMIIYLGRASRPAWNDLPGSSNGADHTYLPYLVFLLVGFAVPETSPFPR